MTRAYLSYLDIDADNSSISEADQPQSLLICGPIRHLHICIAYLRVTDRVSLLPTSLPVDLEFEVLESKDFRVLGQEGSRLG